jgi:hypothetical protein
MGEETGNADCRREQRHGEGQESHTRRHGRETECDREKQWDGEEQPGLQQELEEE